MNRPPGILYGIDDTPPAAVTLFSALQHVGIVAILLVYPLVLATEAGLDEDATLRVISASLGVLGIATVLQALRGPTLGSGFLCPAVCTATYLSPSLLAVRAGGMPMVCGMLLFAGAVECALSRVLRPLRPYTPPELSGLVVLLIGLAVGSLGLRRVLALDGAGVGESGELWVAVLTLAAMFALGAWSAGMARLFCVLIGMAVGCGVAAIFGLRPGSHADVLGHADWFAWPRWVAPGWRWDPSLLVPFVIAALGTVIRGVGDLTIAQKSNDADWKRPGMDSISGGVLANGVANVLAGAMGGHAVSTYTSSVGLAETTGVTSRRVALGVGAIFLALAFFPKIAALLLIIPRRVVGAATIFTAAIIVVSGIKLLAPHLSETRRVQVIGLSVIVGLSVDLYPAFFTALPESVRPFFSSSLVLGTLCAVLLNGLSRIGLHRVDRLMVDPRAPDPDGIGRFMEQRGQAWGAHSDVIVRAGFNLCQSLETIIQAGRPEGPLEVTAMYDEFNVVVRVRYRGQPLAMPTERPSPAEVLDTPDGEQRLAGYMLRRIADQVSSARRGAWNTLIFRFDH